MQKISILASFVSLWLTSFLTNENQILIGFSLIFSFGILHGANDLEIINQFNSEKKSNLSTTVVPYLSGILISFLLFYLIPTVALILFIMVSSYHFGEQHWNKILIDGDNKYLRFFEFNYGLVLFHMVFFFNKSDVIEIVYKITDFKITENFINNSCIAVLILFLLSTCLLLKNSISFKNNVLEQFFYLVLLGIILKEANLIWGFTIYFIFWHSIPSLHDQIEFLYGKFSFANFKKYFFKAFANWIISLVGIFTLYFTAKETILFDALFFSFLGSITFPHAVTMIKMFKTNKL